MGVCIRGWSRLWGLLLRLVVGGRKSNFSLSRFVEVRRQPICSNVRTPRQLPVERLYLMAKVERHVLEQRVFSCHWALPCRRGSVGFFLIN